MRLWMALGFCFVATAGAVEKWADAKLPVSDGLELWLDASRLAGKEQSPITVWPDASGHKRDLRQSSATAQPIQRIEKSGREQSRFVRFDGTDDFLAVTNAARSVEATTIFIVGAPRSNPGGFRALLSANEVGKNDYATGINIDHGFEGGFRFDRLNIEGAGMGGQKNLAKGAHDFGAFHVFAITSATNETGTKLFVDGKLAGNRPRTANPMRFDEIRVGARYYSNTPSPPTPSGFWHGDLAEVLVYGRALTDDERQSIENYLQTKHAALLQRKGLPPEEIIQPLVGGFTVRELPLRVTHINALRYAPDGRLFAAGYDGRIHVLRDTDGDGLEDRVEEFWYRRTIRTPIGVVVRPDGLYVASNGKISRLRDTDNDGKADIEDVVVSGWVKDDGTTGGGVDAMGLAIDKDGNLYFGLGTADYSNAYRVKDGKARYDIRSERGTILKVAPDFKTREIFCTGIRMPYALAFNRLGDLFNTDQEGATWLPNGNPLDELNHIIKGRHYGFPYRHPQYLPDVLDEPTVVGFGPQHQSTCGLVFNESSATQKLFGPREWDGNAFVTGESRGKIWRTQLVKTPSGYVGKPTLFLSSRMLLIDNTISPAGDLVFCCHSGPPDWGTGPQGFGKLFKVSYTDKRAPQPIAAWSASPMEVRVAFDRPLNASIAQEASRATIEFGEYVGAADRLEVLKPPYEVLNAQAGANRGKLRVAGAKLSADKRTLILATDPHPAQATYALTLPNVRGATMDMDYNLCGVEAAWQPERPVPVTSHESPVTKFWLPHLDFNVNRALTAGSTEHEQLEKFIMKKGVLTLVTKLQLPKGKVTLRFFSNAHIQIGFDTITILTGVTTTELSSDGQPSDMQVSFKTGEGDSRLTLNVSYHTDTDPTERPIPLNALLLPWAPPRPPPTPVPSNTRLELAGGDWKRGEQIYYGDEAKCGTCHTIRGKGGRVGPDLSNLAHRDVASILRDIVEPNAMLNPDYVPYTVALHKGEPLDGLVRAEGADKIRVVDVTAKETIVAMKDVREMHPRSVSIMPEGFKALGDAKLRDLMLFLTSAAPPYRSRAEVDASLKTLKTEKSLKTRPLNIVLVASVQDHGPAEHDYPAWQRHWKELLSKATDVTVTTAWKWPKADQWQSADLVVFYFWNHEWSAAQLKDLDDYLARGGGLVALHSATIHDKEPTILAQRIGLAFQPGKSKYRHGPLDLKIIAPKDHPIMRGLTEFHLIDETYWPMFGDMGKIEVLATAVEEGKEWPMVWTNQAGKGRVFSTLLGHYAWTYDDPLFRLMVLRGMAWAVGEPSERFNMLITEGVQLK